MDYQVDVTRAYHVLDRIMDWYNEGAYPYSKKSNMLENFRYPRKLRRRGGEAEVRFWFYACMLMRRLNSDTALNALVKLYDREMTREGVQPFNPRRAARMDPKELAKHFKRSGVGELQDNARDWVNASKRIVERYDGKLMSVVGQIHDWDSALWLLMNEGGRGFQGFKDKMVSMYLFFLMEAGIIEYFDYPPPVDVHLMKVAIQTLMITSPDFEIKDEHDDDTRDLMAYDYQGDVFVPASDYDRFGDIVRYLYFDFILDRGIKSNTFAEAVWLLSRGLCSSNPGNSTSVVHNPKVKPKKTDTPDAQDVLFWVEPIAEERPTGPDFIVLKTRKVNFDTVVDRRRYERSCRLCKLNDVCELNVPTRHQHFMGRIEVKGKRKDLPKLQTSFNT